jgi:bacteriocin-like protein
MKNINYCETNFVQLSQKELMQVVGGTDGVTLFSLVLTGVLDGVKHNTECHLTLFGKKIF